MIIHEVEQGTEEWKELRRLYRPASEAPVVMGASTKMKRGDLLKIKAGIAPEKEHSQWVVDNLFSQGHETESRAREILSSIIGENLSPIVVSEGIYLASLDGINDTLEIGFEHKLWNKQLVDDVLNNQLPAEYSWQLEHQFMACPSLERIIFVCSDGTEENFVSMDYYRQDGAAYRLHNGWELFEADMKDCTAGAPAAEQKAERSLPALCVTIEGSVKSTNFPAFKSSAVAYIEAINTDLKTDQDFADAESAVKFCEKAEKEIELVKKQAIAQTGSIDDLLRAVDEVKEMLRSKRLLLEKLVKTQKESIKSSILKKAEAALYEAITTVNGRISPVRIGNIESDFSGAARGMKSIETFQQAVNAELAASKLRLMDKEKHVTESIKIISSVGRDSLFADIQQLVEKDHDDVRMLVQIRVEKDDAEIARKIEAAKDAQKEVAKEPLKELPKEPEKQTYTVIRAASPESAVQYFNPSRQEIVSVIANHFMVSDQAAEDHIRKLFNPQVYHGAKNAVN